MRGLRISHVLGIYQSVINPNLSIVNRDYGTQELPQIVTLILSHLSLFRGMYFVHRRPPCHPTVAAPPWQPGGLGTYRIPPGCQYRVLIMLHPGLIWWSSRIPYNP